MSDVILFYTTWPDAQAARAAGEAALDARLAACVNILAPIRSIYRWNGRVEHGEEVPMLVKTTSGAAPALRELLLRLHPYELPSLLALPVSEPLSHPAFLAWVRAEASGGQ
jgi:periplasmic divalent cation tolerance protein